MQVAGSKSEGRSEASGIGCMTGAYDAVDLTIVEQGQTACRALDWSQADAAMTHIRGRTTSLADSRRWESRSLTGLAARAREPGSQPSVAVGEQTRHEPDE